MKNPKKYYFMATVSNGHCHGHYKITIKKQNGDEVSRLKLFEAPDLTTALQAMIRTEKELSGK